MCIASPRKKSNHALCAGNLRSWRNRLGVVRHDDYSDSFCLRIGSGLLSRAGVCLSDRRCVAVLLHPLGSVEDQGNGSASPVQHLHARLGHGNLLLLGVVLDVLPAAPQVGIVMETEEFE